MRQTTYDFNDRSGSDWPTPDDDDDKSLPPGIQKLLCVALMYLLFADPLDTILKIRIFLVFRPYYYEAKAILWRATLQKYKNTIDIGSIVLIVCDKFTIVFVSSRLDTGLDPGVALVFDRRLVRVLALHWHCLVSICTETARCCIMYSASIF